MLSAFFSLRRSQETRSLRLLRSHCASRLGAFFSWALLLASACVADYSEEPPPSLDDAPRVDAQRDHLVFERQLRWWSPPASQQARLFQRDDGSLLLLREHWDGTAVYGWTSAELTDAGQQRLADALAAVDPDRTEPAPGEYGCTYFETLPAIVYVDDQPFEYLSLCPPEGLAELATLYEELVELLLGCPLEPSWYEGELPLTQTDCEVAG
jgi:hypothetical protein